MLAAPSVEERLTAIETALAQIKQILETNSKSQTIAPRWEQITGTSAHSGEYTEGDNSGETKIVVSKFEYERLKEEAHEASVVLLTWLDEPSTKAGLQCCANYAIALLQKDLSLRVPRPFELRRNRFEVWRDMWRKRLATAIREEFGRQFPGVASLLSRHTIEETVLAKVWPQVEAELLAFAVEGLARTWVRRHMGDATIIKRPRLAGDHWEVPLGIPGYDTDLGIVVLDRDGNIIEEASSSRQNILAQLHG